MSRILVLGATSVVGRTYSYFLIKFNVFEEIVLAKKRVDVLNKIFEQYRSLNIVTKYIDVNDSRSLKKLMKELDIVLNAIRPLYKYGPKNT